MSRGPERRNGCQFELAARATTGVVQTCPRLTTSSRIRLDDTLDDQLGCSHQHAA